MCVCLFNNFDSGNQIIANKDVENGMFLYCKFIKPFWKAINNIYQFKCINCNFADSKIYSKE